MWRPESGRPRFGRRGAAWFREVLARDLQSRVIEAKQATVTEDALPFALDLYAAEARRFVGWQADTAYFGPMYETGRYIVNWDAVLQAWDAMRAQAIDAAASASDMARFPTLDAWLEADRRGELQCQGAAEPNTRQLLGDKAKLPRGKRLCDQCGELFPEQRCGRGFRRVCGRCLAKRELKRREAFARFSAEMDAKRREADFERGYGETLRLAKEAMERSVEELGRLLYPDNPPPSQSGG